MHIMHSQKIVSLMFPLRGIQYQKMCLFCIRINGIHDRTQFSTGGH